MNPWIRISAAAVFGMVSAHAADIRAQRSGALQLRFDEPVVPLSVVRNGWNETADETDKGTDLFRIDGPSDRLPQARWTDQNELTLTFPENADSAEEYRLSFCEGKDVYLSGKTMVQREFTLRRPPVQLIHREDGSLPAGSITLWPRRIDSPESKAFSPASPVRYTYRQVLSGGETAGRKTDTATEYGREIAARVTPTTLRNGLTDFHLRLLARTPGMNWQALTPDTPLPYSVTVSPAEAPEAGSRWEIKAEGNEKDGFRSETITVIEPEYDSATGIEQMLIPATETTPAAIHLRVRFDSYVALEKVPEIFRKLNISADGVAATDDPNAVSKSCDTATGRVTFRLLPPEAIDIEAISATLPRKEGEAQRTIRYRQPGVTRAFDICVESAMPTETEITIPAGTETGAGRSTTCSHRHRISINPAEPGIQTRENDTLLLQGEQRLIRLKVRNIGSLTAQVRRMDSEKALKAPEILTEYQSNREIADIKHRLAVARGRIAAGLMPHGEEELKEAVAEVEKVSAEERARRAQWEAAAEAATEHVFPEVQLPCTDTGTPMLSEQEIVLNLDELTGGNTKPGQYYIMLRSTPSATVKAAGKALGAEENALNGVRILGIQVSRLNAAVQGRVVTVNNVADGTPVTDGEVIAYNRESGKEFRAGIRNGAAIFAEPLDEKYACLIRSGEDSLLYDVGERFRRADDNEAKLWSFTDRKIYRPGEKVNLHCILRRYQDGEICDCGAGSEAKLRVYRPNGEELCRRSIRLDAFGGGGADFTLPKGDDDITGRYRVELTAGKAKRTGVVQCEEFRRDSFETDAALTITPVAPQEFRVNLKARNYDGTPLAGATAELELRILGSDIPLSADGRTAEKQQPLTVVLTTDADGNAQMTGQLGTIPPGQAPLLRIAGSVTNARGEQVQLPDMTEQLRSAAIEFELTDRNERLRVKETASGKIASAPQEAEVAIYTTGSNRTVHPNGFIESTDQEVCLHRETISIPAGCAEGIVLNLAEKEKAGLIAQKDKLDPHAVRSSYVVIRGKDAEGRTTEYRRALYFRPRSSMESTETGRATAEQRDGSIHLTCTALRSGAANVIINNGIHYRNVPVTLNIGSNDISIPLTPQDYGDVNLSVVQPIPNGDNLFNRLRISNTTITLPRRDRMLDAQLILPQTTLAPGSETEISGRISRNGRGESACITLFAVDAGMLSVSGYELPNPVAIFHSPRGESFSLNGRVRLSGDTMLPLGIFTGVYCGDIIGEGRVLDECAGLQPAMFRKSAGGFDGVYAAPAPPPCMNTTAESGVAGNAGEPRLRTDFAPVAVWADAIQTDADGNFRTVVKLPDTQTTYRVFAVAVGGNGQDFGKAEGEFTVATPLILTPGVPLFASVGDVMQLPLTIANNTDATAELDVSVSFADGSQQLTLAPRKDTTVTFPFTAVQEGINELQWQARGSAGGDAMRTPLEVRFPAPLLREAHHLVLRENEAGCRIAELPAPELREATRRSMQLELSANPTVHLAGAVDFLLNYPYCHNTECMASALLPWLMYEQLAPFCPQLAQTAPAQVKNIVNATVKSLFARQNRDGGLGYWARSGGSSVWCSAQAAMVLSFAAECGYELPEQKMQKLLEYLRKADMSKAAPFTRYAAARALGDTEAAGAALAEAAADKCDLCPEVNADFAFMQAMVQTPEDADAALLRWLRVRGHDYRHTTTLGSSTALTALAEYLQLTTGGNSTATVRTADGTEITLNGGITKFEGSSVPEITPINGTCHAVLKIKAYPEKTEYPGITEKGLQITRIYEKKGADGIWRKAEELHVGDVVRVTLTCAKAAPELRYFVLEDYLPATMEAVNPALLSQAADIEPPTWSSLFDNREYLSDRVRGFCTRWFGRDVINMSYYARVLRAGSATSPPAQAQLMYEPQTYGLSASERITTAP